MAKTTEQSILGDLVRAPTSDSTMDAAYWVKLRKSRHRGQSVSRKSGARRHKSKNTIVLARFKV